MDQNVATTWNREDRDLLIELRTRMEGMTSSVERIEKAISTKEADHENRIRSLERQRWFIAGGSSTLATAISTAVTLLIN